MSIKFEDYLKQLETQRSGFNDVLKKGAQTLAERHEYVTTQLKEGDADYQERMDAFDAALKAQQDVRKQITEVEEVIEELVITDYVAKSGVAPKAKGIGSSIIGSITDTSATTGGERRDISNLGDDIRDYMIRKGYTSTSKLKTLQSNTVEQLPDGGTFTSCLQFQVGFGSDSITDDKELVSDIGINPEDMTRFKARKSMFTQHPLAGGQTVLGVGDNYNPEGIFEGNTGGIFEYDIDRNLYNIPYAPQGIMTVLTPQQVTGSSHHFIRQTLRINNAVALLDSITAPPRNFIQEKPQNEYGWTLFKTYVMTYAASVILADEVAEDARPIADAVKSQLGTDVLRTMANSMANGVNTTSAADITGLFNLAGINTRIHRSTAAFASPLNSGGINPSASLVGDDERVTLERAVLDLQRWGFSPDYILTSFEIIDKMAFLFDIDGRKRYTEEQLNNIRGAKVVGGSEVLSTKAMVGDYNMAVRALMRMGITIEIGFINDQFVTDQFTIRARCRGGLKAMRPYALERVTFT